MKSCSLVLQLTASLAVWTLACVVCSADPMTDLWNRRDKWASHKMFVWETMTTVNWKLDAREEASLRSQGVAVPPSRRILEGWLTIARTPGLTYVEHAQVRTIPEQRGRFYYWFGTDYCVVTTNSASSNYPDAVWIFPAHGDGLYTGVPLSLPTPDEVTRWLHPSFVAGVAPDRVQTPLIWLLKGAKVSWSVAGRRDRFVILNLSSSTGAQGTSAELLVDTRRQFAPAYFRARTGSLDLEMRVLGWYEVEGWQVPSTLELQVTESFRTQSTRFVLRQVSDSPPLKVNLPTGVLVTDMREVPLESVALRGLYGVQGSIYRYTWNGVLPRREMLSVVGTRVEQAVRMVIPQQTTEQRNVVDFLRWFTPPAVFILIGALWYWRLRRRERA